MIHSNAPLKIRRASGQTLAGGAGLLVALTLLGVGLVLVTLYQMCFCFNAMYQSRLAQSLESAAKHGVDSSENLGVKVANFDVNGEVLDAATILCNEAGIPGCHINSPCATNSNGAPSLVVTGSAAGLPVVVSGSIASVSALGMATIGTSAPPGIAEIAFNTGTWSILLPSYGHGDGAQMGPPSEGLSWWYFYYNFFDNDNSSAN